MIDRLLAQLAPHLCCGCEKTGTLLCDNCKYDITNEQYAGCVVCGAAAGVIGVCQNCAAAYSRAWCVGERTDTLRQLIDDFKFENAYAAHSPLAALLDEQLGQLPENTVIVPVPTIAPHIRQRGYDHTLLIAKALAERRHLAVSRALRRATITRQRGADRETRARQAERAFVTKGTLEADRSYLLIDDIITTGATVEYAARALRRAGAGDVWVAALARQPLD